MDKPIRSNGYLKYLIQIGWFEPSPGILLSVMAQDVLARTEQDAMFLMKTLYPNTIGINFPNLCPIIAEIKGSIGDNGEDTHDLDSIKGIERIDLIFPN